MNKIFFFARDPGGVNVLIPVILRVQEKFDIVTYAKDGAVNRFKNEGIDCQDISQCCEILDEIHLEKLILSEKTNLVMTGTSADDFTEKKLWNIAKRKNIPSIAIVDSWVNYGIRFSKYSSKEMDKYCLNKDLSYLPDYILTMDKESKEDMIKEGIPREKIVITGQPYLEYVRERIINTDVTIIDNYKRQLNVGANNKLIVYASDNMFQDFNEQTGNSYWGYNERTIFTELVNVLKKDSIRKNSFVILVRPHPKEDIQYWEGICDKYPELHIRIDAESMSDIIINAADLVISMQSMFLVEAALVGKNVMSVQIGLQREEPLILSKLGILSTIRDSVELEQRLINYFDDSKKMRIIWDIGSEAIEKVVHFIEEVLWQN